MTKIVEDDKWRVVKMEIALRGYREGDHHAMYALDVACFARAFRFSRAAMRRFATASNARVVMAEDAEMLAGFGILHIERVEHGLAGYVMTLDVDPRYRRLGVGRRLMAAMETQAQADGCAEMRLHVFTGNEAAIRFYERIGFSRSGWAEGFYGAGLVGPRDAWVYRKQVDSAMRGERE